MPTIGLLLEYIIAKKELTPDSIGFKDVSNSINLNQLLFNTVSEVLLEIDNFLSG
ncbi:hypothetical protein VCSRO55_1683 [Vibrio cholerae]|nr:hypothetical protein VCSRO55_1683 [Vibrio cholerae]